ncbi:MAG: F0F1 ATP synthase subunit A [Proteiniphilum sp.]|jgi:F-type H+-transporting ATPase subunit a|nr:F0F1 ATP synthase subunit A [Proteiniphilum sp.]
MKRALFILAVLIFTTSPVYVWAGNQNSAIEDLNAKEFISEHLSDSYEWQIVSDGAKHITVPLSIILYSKTTGWHLFPSSHFQHGTAAYNGFKIASEGKYKGKIVETDARENISRPLDLSLTKNAASLLFASLLIILIIMGVARLLKRDSMKPRKGFAGMIEMLVLSINDEVIKPSIGKDHQRYAPYLLTVFFFIFTNNLLGLIPVFPGGANVTGNIAVTLVLAVATFLIINLTGTKEYYKEILWPDVPTWLKIPIPLMPIVEIVGTLTKPFALMIRLFANMMAGHSIVLGLTMLIFITASMGMAINVSMTFLSVIFTVFIDFVELLIAYIQAYVFTLLSAVFIGLARMESHSEKKKVIETGQVA